MKNDDFTYTHATERSEESFIARMLACFLASGIVAIDCLCLQYFWVPDIEKDYLPLIHEAFVPNVWDACQPEPLERTQFLLSLVMFPLLFGASYLLIRRKLKRANLDADTLASVNTLVYAAVLLSGCFLLRMVLAEMTLATRVPWWLTENPAPFFSRGG